MFMKRKIISGLIIVAFILFIVTTIFYASNLHNLRKLDPVALESMNKEQIIQEIYTRQSQSLPLYYVIPIFGFFGVVVGALVYYIMSGNVERKDKLLLHNTEVLFKLLDPQERKVIKKIVENHGKIQQVEITYMDGFTKVKAHRIIESLVQKGILEKEKLGKMRLIRMNNDLYEILKNKD